MSLSQAFGITEEDLETVLCSNALQVANSDGKSFEDMSTEFFSSWPSKYHDRVASAALDASCDIEGQTEAAHAEIRLIFVETGVLKR